eukprot:scaffold585051_cov26-Prasinocladus_malaysianus.AAC.1
MSGPRYLTNIRDEITVNKEGIASIVPVEQQSYFSHVDQLGIMRLSGVCKQSQSALQTGSMGEPRGSTAHWYADTARCRPFQSWQESHVDILCAALSMKTSAEDLPQWSHGKYGRPA